MNKKKHPAADALDWNEAMNLINQLIEDCEFRNALLIACGCYLGLRISDILKLKWIDVYNKKILTINEQKTGKNRLLKVNPKLSQIINKCHYYLCVEDDNTYLFSGQIYGQYTPITRQRADQILKEIKKKYNIKSAHTFSTHSLRKTFGRRVWLQQCKKGKGDQALLLLQDVFGHSSTAITKRYLGIRQDEILSVYDTLTL